MTTPLISPDDLRSALAAGTKRPWDPSPISDDEIATYMFKPADARLIVAAVNNAEALLDRVAELEKALVEACNMAASPYVQTPRPSQFTSGRTVTADRLAELRALAVPR